MPPGPGAADHHQHQAAASPRRSGVMLMPQSPLRIKQDGKFYERLLTKESSASAGGNLSFRYYWADQPGSVPFVWETQPGTPRDVVGVGTSGALPAITPPPSYLLRHVASKVVAAASPRRHQQSKNKVRNHSKGCCRLKRIKIGFIAGIFRRLSFVNNKAAVKVSSSSRWLFCSAATERGTGIGKHENETTAPARQRQQKTTATVMCCRSFRSPWLPRFGSARNGSGWA